MAGKDDLAGRPEDPFVRARIPDPAQPAPRVFTISGLLGNSDRPGRRRLYLNTRLDYFVEFHTEDVLAVEAVGPDIRPFVGFDSTRVTLAMDARVDFVRTQTGPVSDPFEVESSLAGGEPAELRGARVVLLDTLHGATSEGFAFRGGFVV